MSDAPARRDPVPPEPYVMTGTTLVLAPATSRYSLRGAAGDLQPLVPIALPARIGDVTDGTHGLAVMLGPDEWLLLGTVAGDGAGLALSIVDVTERQIGLTLEGPGSAALLMTGCPLDLQRMPVGRGTRTIYETVEIIVIKRAEDRFHVEIWRSFAPWLWGALTSAG